MNKSDILFCQNSKNKIKKKSNFIFSNLVLALYVIKSKYLDLHSSRILLYALLGPKISKTIFHLRKESYFKPKSCNREKFTVTIF